MSKGDLAMEKIFDYASYLSPFTDRYGSSEMRSIWSERYKRILWRRLWVALAESFRQFQLVTLAQVEDLRTHQEDIDLAAANALEVETRHDIMAEIRIFAGQCSVGGSIIHLGATSADIEDNAEIMRIREALALIISQVRSLLSVLAERISQWSDVPSMGFTHLQAAEPTTVGYRLAQYGQDLLLDLQQLEYIFAHLRGKGLRGAVGTSASFADLLGEEGDELAKWRHTADITKKTLELEAHFMGMLDLRASLVSTQTYPRKQDWLVLNSLAGVAGSLYKLAFDLRILQSPGFGEWFEPAGIKQVSSSAMPFKRNPVSAETINSLGRLIAQLPRISWDNAAHSLLERTLDDAANRREILPTAFLALDEMLHQAIDIITSLYIDVEAMRKNLTYFELVTSIERVLSFCVKQGGDRQQLHEILREHVVIMNSEMRAGYPNSLREHLASDKRICQFIPSESLDAILNLSGYVGDAPYRARLLVEKIHLRLSKRSCNSTWMTDEGV